MLDGNWVFGFWILGDNCGKYWIMHGLILGTIVIFGEWDYGFVNDGNKGMLWDSMVFGW